MNELWALSNCWPVRSNNSARFAGSSQNENQPKPTSQRSSTESSTKSQMSRRPALVSSLPTTSEETGDAEDLDDLVAGRLRGEGLDPLFVDLSPPGGEVRVVKAIVPGLEVETASYARIGARNLRRLLRRGDALAGTDDPPPGARPILLPEGERERFGPEPWLDVAAIDRTVGRLYPLYREPSRHLAALVADGVL